ncbi:hypothetical protein NUU61_005825 [Penicillium alfredii]|uniref:Zinc-binding loop region of homing endonuclease domain-containing protein n=1 Tax=Penicillium alfredii TaxID=1506179 RepID=A0A9W9FAL3_9EURO|nr:uncharacterized protein NUU61_005825 [Penicillium alfredii]KAJ5096469.1 hypothetical protein NUU61_005825 [Penicillium alfredii]
MQTKLVFTRPGGLKPPHSPPALLSTPRRLSPLPQLKNASIDAKSPDTTRQATKLSRMAMELALVSRADARRALQRLQNGAQGAKPRGTRTYKLKSPIVRRSRVLKGIPPRRTPAPQNAHRPVVLAEKTDEEIARLLAGEQASHLCHQPTCVNPDHIVVEPKMANEARKGCRSLGPTIKTVWNGKVLSLPPRGVCNRPGQRCVFMIEWRHAVADE